MKIRIYLIFVCILLIASIIPISIAAETVTKNNSELNSMLFCDVHIKGTATVQVIRGDFFLGFGKCFYMKVDLENDGSLKISSILNPSNSVELNGNNQIHIIGFNGYYNEILKTRINGQALLVIWG